MNRMPSIVIAMCVLAATFEVSAQTAPQAQVDLQITAQSDLDHADGTASNAPGNKVAEKILPNCVQYTGSRIRSVDRKTGKSACVQGPGRSYGRDDLDRTGQADIADALRHLDPSIK